MVPNAEIRACLPWRDCFPVRLAQVLAVSLIATEVTCRITYDIFPRRETGTEALDRASRMREPETDENAVARKSLRLSGNHADPRSSGFCSLVCTRNRSPDSSAAVQGTGALDRHGRVLHGGTSAARVRAHDRGATEALRGTGN